MVIYYKNFMFHPCCDCEIRCEMHQGKASWLYVYKDFEYHKERITREEARYYIKKFREEWTFK